MNTFCAYRRAGLILARFAHNPREVKRQSAIFIAGLPETLQKTTDTDFLLMYNDFTTTTRPTTSAKIDNVCYNAILGAT